MTDDTWQQNESQAKEAGRVVLDTKAAIRKALSDGTIRLWASCGCPTEEEKARLKVVALLEELGVP